MSKNKGTFVIDNSVPQKLRDEITERVRSDLDKVSKTDLSERESILKKRQDFFEGRHHLWTNVVGQTLKQEEGHIQAVFNYILKFCQKVHQTLIKPPKIKLVPKDEGDEIETARAEGVEEAIRKVFTDNKFWNVIFDRASMNQIRDGDFILDCKVQEDAEFGKHIEIGCTEDLLKILVGWDDASGSSYSWIAFRDLWTVTKIKREFDYDAEPMSDQKIGSEKQGSHLNDQFGIFASTTQSTPSVPSGKTSLPKAEIVDYWGYEVIEKQVKVLNLIFIGKDCVQFLVTDYKRIPRFPGHSFPSPGKPWSMSFIDPLVDPQIELNDRTGEEGDLVRVGSHMKFLVINMQDFDPDSIKPGSGQVIYLEGENVDFKPLPMTISTFPSDNYLSRVLDHLFNIGIPKIALAAGTAPYTGRVGAIQYQPFADIVDYLRLKWEVVLEELIITIQQYFIDYFPELHPILREHLYDEQTGEGSDGDLVIRDIQFDWDNVLPLSRSDRVVDASTMRDRGSISLYTYLEEAGYKNPGAEIKRLKKELRDPDLMTIREKFTQFAPGVVSAQLEARQKMIQAEEQNAETMGALNQTVNQGTPKSNPPILTTEQNSGRRGVLTGAGSPSGQTASLKGNVAQTTQNINAKAGI